MKSTSTLQETLEKAAFGDEEAFHYLYTELIDRIFGYVKGRVRSEADALDVAQDVFVDLWEALPRFQYASDTAFYAFIFTITKRRLSRYYRANRPTVSLDEEAIPSHLLAISPDIEDTNLQEIVQTLPEGYRDVLMLRYWSGLPFAEIADMLGTTETNVKVRHHRAIKKLTEFFEKNDTAK